MKTIPGRPDTTFSFKVSRRCSAETSCGHKPAEIMNSPVSVAGFELRPPRRLRDGNYLITA
jgi:hypothetical protein